MKTKYEITGMKKDGDRIRLVLKLFEPTIDQKNLESIMQDPAAFLNKQQLDAARAHNPESVTISVDQCKQDRPGLGHIIEIYVSPTIGTIDQSNTIPINKVADQNESSPQKKTNEQDVSGVYGYN